MNQATERKPLVETHKWVCWPVGSPPNFPSRYNWCKVLYGWDGCGEAPADIWNSGSANPYRPKEII
jgi:hypothetical protein